MTEEVEIINERTFPKKMYPENASNSPYLKRLDNREESLLGTFIQWVDDKSKKVEKKKTGNIPKTNTVNGNTTENERRKLKLNFMKQNRSKTSDKNSKGEGGLLRDNHTTSLLEGVHLSRPNTPVGPAAPKPQSKSSTNLQPSPELDKYRIMYLLVKVEQQQEHLRQVIDNMGRMGRSEDEIQNMVNAQAAVSKMHGHLVGVRDNDHVMTKHIGNGADLEEFLQTIEHGCSLIEELPVPGLNDDKMTPFKLRRRKNTPPSSSDITMRREYTNSPLASNTQKEPATPILEDTMHTTKSKEEKQHTDKSAKKDALKKSCTLPFIGGQGKPESDVTSLMKEIDELMDDSGLINGKNRNLMSYESIMLGAGEKNHITKVLDERPASKQSDHFMDDLDKLLDECETA